MVSIFPEKQTIYGIARKFGIDRATVQAPNRSVPRIDVDAVRTLISATSDRPPTENRKYLRSRARATDFPIEVFPTPAFPRMCDMSICVMCHSKHPMQKEARGLHAQPKRGALPTSSSWPAPTTQAVHIMAEAMHAKQTLDCSRS